MKVLLIIDMLNDFIKEDGVLYCGDNVKDVVPFVRNKIEEFKKERNPIIYVVDSHKEDDKEFEMFPKHCVKGEEGAKIYKEVLVEGALVIEKSRYSAFYNTQLEEILLKYSENNFENLEAHVVGVCTNICVLYTVEELRNRDMKTIVYKDGVTSFDDEAHDFALNQMENVLGAKIK